MEPEEVSSAGPRLNNPPAPVSAPAACSYLAQRLHAGGRKQGHCYKHFQISFALFKCFNPRRYTSTHIHTQCESRCRCWAPTSTFHCLIAADCFCVVICSLLEEGVWKQACAGSSPLPPHYPPDSHHINISRSDPVLFIAVHIHITQ